MTMFRADLLKGKRILVTGGGTGLGNEMADEYAKLGAEVYICGRRGPVVEETAQGTVEGARHARHRARMRHPRRPTPSKT